MKNIFTVIPSLCLVASCLIADINPSVTYTIWCGTGPTSLSMGPNGEKLFVTNQSNHNIAIIDTTSNEIIDLVYVTGDPIVCTVDAANLYAYALNQPADQSMSASVTTMSVNENIALSHLYIDEGPSAIVTTSNSLTAYITNSVSNTVSVVNNQSVSSIPVGKCPIHLAYVPSIDPKNNEEYIYVANFDSNDIFVISTSNNKVLTTIPVGQGPTHISITPDTQQAYVANKYDGSVSVIDTSTHQVTHTLKVGEAPVAILITQDTPKAYVINEHSDTVSVLNTANNTLITTIPVEYKPSACDITPDEQFLFVVNSDSNTISIIDTEKNEVFMTLPVGGHPVAVQITSDGSQAYVANFVGDNISVINMGN